MVKKEIIKRKENNRKQFDKGLFESLQVFKKPVLFQLLPQIHNVTYSVICLVSTWGGTYSWLVSTLH